MSFLHLLGKRQPPDHLTDVDFVSKTTKLVVRDLPLHFIAFFATDDPRVVDLARRGHLVL